MYLSVGENLGLNSYVQAHQMMVVVVMMMIEGHAVNVIFVLH